MAPRLPSTAAFADCADWHGVPSRDFVQHPVARVPLRNSPAMVNHRRGPWSSYEDQCLSRLVRLNGAHNWVRISSEIRTRSPKQCRERYHQNLKPNLNHAPITLEEGEIIKRLVEEIGKKWAEIARRLPGRSDNAVKNWWNGCQHRRKKDPSQQETRRSEQAYSSQPAYHHAAVPQRSPVHTTQPLLPPIRDIREFPEPSYYSMSRRPSLNPATTSPHSIKLPHPRPFEAYPGSRPQPLQLPPYQYNPRAQGYETPMPSPGYSIASVDAPSLVTDTGSETRSPRGAVSPLDHSLPPTFGSRDARRGSATRYTPASGFVQDDDEHAHYAQYRRRSSIQLAPLNYPERPHEKPQLLIQPAPQLVHQRSLQLSPLLPSSAQQPLPPYQGLTLPQPQASPSTGLRPSLPSPSALLGLTGASRSAPSSPHTGSAPRDNRMSINNIL